jgi:tetratricopeptide (TPR) repeat protein
LLDAGRFEEARREFETYVELSPRDPKSHDRLGDYHLVVGDPETALGHFARAFEVEPTSDFFRPGPALAYGMLGRFDQALREAEQFPGMMRWALKAFLLSRVGRYREAEEIILEGTDASESYLYIYYGIQMIACLIETERGRFDRMAEISDRVLEMTLRSPERELRESMAQAAHANAGVAHARSGNLEAARRHLETLETLLLQPHWWPLDWSLGALEGEIALAAGDLDAAETHFKAAEPKPKMLFHRGALAGAIAVNHDRCRDGLARVAKARGDLDAAIEIYRRLNTPGLDNPWTSVLEPRYVLEVARLLDQKGDHAAAHEEYARFLQLWKNADPDLPELAEARTRLAQLDSSDT